MGIEYDNPIHVILISIYWVVCMVCIGLIYMAYTKSNMNYIRYSYTMIGTRNILSMHDFEGLKQTQEQTILFALQVIIVLYFLLQVINSTKPSKFKTFQIFFFTIFLSSGLGSGFRLYDFSTVGSSFKSVGMAIIALTINYSYYRIQAMTQDNLII